MSALPLDLACAQDGQTTHVRFHPYERRFSQRLAQVTFDIDRIAEAAARLRLFSYNAPNLFSFFDRDHGDRSGAPLRPWAQALLAQAGVTLDGGTITITCFPRMFGSVFNPLSVFVGYGPDRRPRGFVYEVNNTFGETHAYVARASDGECHEHRADKRFHVSPFMDVTGFYRFVMRTPGDRFSLTVENVIGDERRHLASLTTAKRPLTDRWLAGAALRFPFMTAQIVGGIHLQALAIWLRGARYHPKPMPPNERATFTRD
jgi:DUF1365 family protein